MRVFADATPLLDDPAALRARFVEDSHLFFRGLLPHDAVLQVRADVLDVLADLGWVDPGDDTPKAPPANEGDPDWFPMYTAVQSLESFHRLPFQPALLQVAAAVLDDPTVLVHPRKIARINFPDNEFGTTGPHQDLPLIQGTPDALTAWMPLGSCSSKQGGLRILRGSHTARLRPTLPNPAVGGIKVDVDDDDPNWTTIEYEPGDVVVFHSLTVHAAQSNRSGRLRLSADFRFQPLADPVAAASLVPHFHPGVPGWEELTRGWTGTDPIEAPGANVVPDVPVTEVRSRFLPV